MIHFIFCVCVFSQEKYAYYFTLNCSKKILRKLKFSSGADTCKRLPLCSFPNCTAGRDSRNQQLQHPHFTDGKPGAQQDRAMSATLHSSLATQPAPNSFSVMDQSSSNLGRLEQKHHGIFSKAFPQKVNSDTIAFPYRTIFQENRKVEKEYKKKNKFKI